MRREFTNTLSVHEYTILTSALSELMGRQDILGKDISVVQDIFMNSLIEVFKISLDVSIDNAKFEEFLTGCDSQPNDREVIEFVMEVTENEKTYAIVSYFLLFSLFTIYESIGREEKVELEELFERHSVDEDLCDGVIGNFRRIADELS